MKSRLLLIAFFGLFCFEGYGQTIAAGGRNYLALKKDGSIFAWGKNDDGQCNVPVGLKGVIAVSGGGYHSLALKEDGTVVVWGWNAFGQCNVSHNARGVTAISAGSAHSLALKKDGTVVAWGWNDYKQSEIPYGLRGVIAIAAGGNNSLALKEDGTVVAWGLNDDVPVGLKGVIAVSGGGYHSLALKEDGTVVVWGKNDDGQCNVPYGLTGVVAVSGGVLHSLALKEDGSVVAWGNNNDGQCYVPGGLKVKTSSDAMLMDSKDESLTIEMIKKPGGTYEIPCEVNGLPLTFIFDTGASDVTLSAIEAMFMMRHGYFKESDITGVQNYKIANGDIVEGTTINIRQLKVGDILLKNIDASISHEIQAPLLLGQSAISKLGTIQINPTTNTLTIIK